MKVALVQMNLAWEDPSSNAQQLAELCQSFQADWFILPEMWICGFTMNPKAYCWEDQARQAMANLAREKSAFVAGGLPVGTDVGQKNGFYLFSPQGALQGTYYKIKRFAYANEDEFYQAGTELNLWTLNDWKVVPQVCYDLRFPELARAKAHQGDMLVYVANWPERRSHHWRSLLVARAIENQCYVIGVNRVGVDGNQIEHRGDSMVISPLGDVIGSLAGEPGVLCVEVRIEEVKRVRQRWPFLNDRSRFQFDVEMFG